jgi:serine/threonine protein kinase
MELAKNTLQSLLVEKFKEKVSFLEVEIMKFLSQMASILAHMQRLNIAHRDIKPQNILINKQNDYILCDVGVGK